MNQDAIAGLLLLIIVGGLAIIVLALRNHHRMRELIMRERIAMLEKGLVPPPEMDPGRFDRVERLLVARERLNRSSQRRVTASGQRYRSLGVMTMGFGLAFTVLLTFAGGVPGAGLGVGGAFVVVGAAMFINGMMLGHGAIDEPDEENVPPVEPSGPAQEPPPNVAP